MGIKGLTKLIGDEASGAMKETKLENYFSRKVAIDASMSIYQFMVAVRSGGDNLQNEAGEVTSHLQGMFHRTIRLLENGLKVVYVFDGKPPTLKGGELAKRQERKQEALDSLKQAQDSGNQEDIDKFNRRTVRVTKEQNEECKRLLQMMGVPIVEAPCEAEAQCAELARGGKVWAAASEDMDTLTFGAPKLIRHLTFSEARKIPPNEFDLTAVLTGLDITMDQFIDVCILSGCDYADNIRGIGSATALKLIRKHKTIEAVLENIDTTKYPVPEVFPVDEVRRLFKEPEVTPADKFDFTWNEPDEEGLVKFLSGEKGFQEERVRNGVKKLRAARGKSQQGRLESFFGAPTVISHKRKVEAPAGSNKKGRGAKAGGRGRGGRR